MEIKLCHIILGLGEVLNFSFIKSKMVLILSLNSSYFCNMNWSSYVSSGYDEP